MRVIFDQRDCMREIKTEFIEKIINVMKNNELSEVQLEKNDCSIYIKADDVEYKYSIEEQKSDIAKEQEKKEEKKIIPIISNMIGVLFLSPSPNEKPFVKVGDKIKEGDQVCIIETIKLMNKVVSEVSGTVKEICIENAKPVEYGQTIMYIEQE